MEVGFLLLPCVCQGLNSDNQVWQCIPLPTGPSFQSCFWFLFFWSNPVRPETDCSPDWSETNGDPVTLASWMLGLKSYLPWALYGSGKQLCSLPHHPLSCQMLLSPEDLLVPCMDTSRYKSEAEISREDFRKVIPGFPQVVTSLWEL